VILQLTVSQQNHLQSHLATGLGVSVISCWEVAMLVAKGRLGLSMSVDNWIASALVRPMLTADARILAYPHVQTLT
jgi:PIN domain nuclease of toxin-antitoxin system